MINIIDKKKCCGCTACENACPQKCIKMIEDREGFIYPQVDTQRCIECHLCEKVCPVLNPVNLPQDELKTYVVRDKRKDILKNSTSGGVFTSVMEYILLQRGVVYGVIMDDDRVIKHIRVDDISDPRLKMIPGSKYVKSEIRGIFQQVKRDLETSKVVCFSGTPCQVAGLKAFLRKDFENLITVDVVCRGNPSPLYWKRYVAYQEKRYGGRITEAKFRSKTYGYHSGSMRLSFANGKKYVGSVRVNLFLKAFFEDLCSRPSCYDCAFKHAHRVSDLTIYDCWHAGKLANLKDDDRGYTNVIIQSEKGRKLLDEIRQSLDVYETDTEKAIALDGIMVRNCVEWNDRRETFFDDLEQADDLEQHCNKYFRISAKDHLIEGVKKYVYFFK